MIAIITITDSPDGKKCSVDIHFDPPYKKENQTPATIAATLALSAIQRGATGWKQTLIVTKDDEDKTKGN